MKRLAWLFSLLSVSLLALAACGGGGGGAHGSGGPSAALGPVISPGNVAGVGSGSAVTQRQLTQISNQNDVAKELLPEHLANDVTTTGRAAPALAKPFFSDHQSSVVIERNGDITIYYDKTVSFNKGDIKFYEDKDNLWKGENSGKGIREFAAMTKTDGGSADILWVGRLDYAAFGYWAHIIADEKGTYSGDLNTYGGGIDADKAQFNNKELAFTGVAAGVASFGDIGRSKDVATPIKGTAELKLGDNGSGTLALRFAEVNLDGKVTAASAGNISGKFDTVTNKGNLFSDVLKQGTTNIGNGGTIEIENYIRGQLYGDGTSPSEATGNWNAFGAGKGDGTENNPYDLWWRVEGVFGVK